MNNLTFSIIIPVYNGQDFIKQTLESCLSQDFSSFNIIVIDDNSQDNSLSIIREIMISDKRIQLIKNIANIGLGPSFNLAALSSEADWIVNLGHDDLIPPNYLSVISQHLNLDIAIIHTNDIMIDNSGVKLRSLGINKSLKSRFPLFFLSYENFISFIGVVINKNYFIDIGGFKHISSNLKITNSLTSEILLWVELSSKGDFIFVPKVKTFYRWHDNNLSHKSAYLKEMAFLDLNAHKLAKEKLLQNKFLTKNTIALALFFSQQLGVVSKSIKKTIKMKG